MRERLLSSDDPPLAVMDEHHNHPEARLLQCQQQQHTPVGTVVKVRSNFQALRVCPCVPSVAQLEVLKQTVFCALEFVFEVHLYLCSFEFGNQLIVVSER